MTSTAPYAFDNMADDDLLQLIELIGENLQEVARNSSYAYRNRPILQRAVAAATSRGLM